MTFIPVSTYAGILPSRKSRITAPVGGGFTSPQPMGKVGLTITTSTPRRAASRPSTPAPPGLLADERLRLALAPLVRSGRRAPRRRALVGQDAVVHASDGGDAG